MKIALFDIDGTLLTTAGAAREAFTRALSEAVGRPITTDGYPFSGRTDPEIARDVLILNGIDGPDLSSLVPETVRLYLRYFEEGPPSLPKAQVLPGVRALLDALSPLRDDRGTPVRTALLTGNVEAGARLKLGHLGILDYFEFPLSAFGSDDADRYRLPAIALTRARRAIGEDVQGADLVIIGDSEHDVLCAREVGARSVAVCTGWTAADTLRSLGPHSLLEDFSDTSRALAAILGE